MRAEGQSARRRTDAARLIYAVATLFAGLIGMFILWRGGRAWTAMLLGFGLTCYGDISDIPATSPSAPAGSPWTARRLGASGAALALPMLNRAEVTGVVLIAAKPTGLAFRPDEIALLSDAARGIGQDLHALKVERLEALAERLAIEKAALTGRGDVLRAAG